MKALVGAWPIQRWSTRVILYKYCTILSTIAYMQVIHLLHCREWLEVKYLDLNEYFGTMFLHKVISSFHYEIIIIYFKIYISHFQLSVNKTSLWCTSNILDLLYVTLHVTYNFTDTWSSCFSMHYAVSFNINILLKFRHDYKYK